MSTWDDEAGYDRGDPKHPDFAESWLAHADMLRKREKEDAWPVGSDGRPCDACVEDDHVGLVPCPAHEEAR